MVFNDVDGLYTHTFEAERKVGAWRASVISGLVACLDDACVSLFVFQENCSACSQIPLDLHFSPSSKLQEVLDYLTESASLYVHLIDRDDLILIILFVQHYLSSTGDHIYATLCCSVFSNRKNVFFLFSDKWNHLL